MPSFVNIEKYEFLKSAFMSIIPKIRESFVMKQHDEVKGSRFNSNRRIWSFVRGELGREDRELSFDEVILGELPKNEMRKRILAGLHDAASADHWYLHEKDYD